jgi:hypothetical protein
VKLPRLAIFLFLWSSALGCATLEPLHRTDSTAGDSGTDEPGSGGAGSSDNDEASSGVSGQSRPSGSSNGSAGGTASQPDSPGNCSLMASNKVCADCLAASCCDVLNQCMDADFLGCTNCLDCVLSGAGPECCDESVETNTWLYECVEWNCTQECG